MFIKWMIIPLWILQKKKGMFEVYRVSKIFLIVREAKRINQVLLEKDSLAIYISDLLMWKWDSSDE